MNVLTVLSISGICLTYMLIVSDHNRLMLDNITSAIKYKQDYYITEGLLVHAMTKFKRDLGQLNLPYEKSFIYRPDNNLYTAKFIIDQVDSIFTIQVQLMQDITSDNNGIRRLVGSMSCNLIQDIDDKFIISSWQQDNL